MAFQLFQTTQLITHNYCYYRVELFLMSFKSFHTTQLVTHNYCYYRVTLFLMTFKLFQITNLLTILVNTEFNCLIQHSDHSKLHNYCLQYGNQRTVFS